MSITLPDGVVVDLDVAKTLAADGIAVRIESIGYPVIQIDGRRVRLHRYVMNEPIGLEVDHINRNKLDCRRINLRVSTHQQNACNSKMRRHNTSGFRGVHFCSITNRWRAEVRVNGKGKKVGRFDTPEQAAIAYDSAAIQHHGDFAVTNAALGLLPNTGCDA